MTDVKLCPKCGKPMGVVRFCCGRKKWKCDKCMVYIDKKK